MATPALSVRGVTYRYGSRAALSDVTFSVAPGEAVGYLGPNGAGKSTTLKLLAGILRPGNGTVEVFGSPAAGPSRARVGALLETPGVPGYLHGDDLLRYVADVRGIPAGARDDAVRRAAAALGVAERLQEPVGGLSTGLTRRLMIATALVGEPEVLLLDEPTLGLDPAARHDLRQVLRSLHDAGRTLLLSTHLLDDVEAICGRVLFLRDGRLIGDEPVQGGPASAGVRSTRSVVLRFTGRVEPAAVIAFLEPGEIAHSDNDREVTAEIRSDDGRQAELISDIVGAGLPLLGAAPVLDRLTRRYLEAVGREDEP